MLGGLGACVAWTVLGHPYFLGLDPAEAGTFASAPLFLGVSLGTRPVSADAIAIFFPTLPIGAASGARD